MSLLPRLQAGAAADLPSLLPDSQGGGELRVGGARPLSGLPPPPPSAASALSSCVWSVGLGFPKRFSDYQWSCPWPVGWRRETPLSPSFLSASSRCRRSDPLPPVRLRDGADAGACTRRSSEPRKRPRGEIADLAVWCRRQAQ